ncbi:MAG: tetratricopeptide repeat protein [Dehalococcoidia bacterium]|nr:tetratricopeptide repeat protein [Dehalococcoidia bacterium]
MSFIREDQLTMKRQLTQEAIELAMQGLWTEAVQINQEILESYPGDSDAHNRLGRALLELGRYQEARDAYRQSLELDPYNSIAKKNLSRLELLGDQDATPQIEAQRVIPQLFISETGRTGIVALVHPAPLNVLGRKAAGDEVFLKVDSQRLMVEDSQGTYLGEVEARHSPRLIRLMEGGNQYAAAIARISGNQVRLVVRETFQHPDLAGRPSFPPVKSSALRPVDTQIEEDEEVIPLDEGDEEPLPPRALEELEAPAEEWGAIGD